MNRNLEFQGELEAKLLPKGEGALPNPPPKEYPNFYQRPEGPNPTPKLWWWQRAARAFHSWNLNRKLKNGSAVRGRTSESD